VEDESLIEKLQQVNSDKNRIYQILRTLLAVTQKIAKLQSKT
jgi:hypothetical protein